MKEAGTNRTFSSNAGIYCFSRDLLPELPTNQYSSLEIDLLPNWCQRLLVSSYSVSAPIFDIGTAAGANEYRLYKKGG